MPNFFCGSLVVVRCGPQGLSVLFDRPGDRTAAVAAGYSYLLVSKGSAKTIRMSLSREQPPARVERAQQEQDYAASRSGHAGCRLFLSPLQARMRRFKTASRGDRRLLCFLLVPDASFPPRSAANDSRLAKKAFKKMRTKSASGGDGARAPPRIVARSQR